MSKRIVITKSKLFAMPSVQEKVASLKDGETAFFHMPFYKLERSEIRYLKSIGYEAFLDDRMGVISGIAVKKLARH
jgi:hypothetical protein